MVHLKVTDENYRRSPLIQGGLEIPVEVICEMDDTPRNRAIMERYKTLVTTHYKEPGQDGQFDDCTKDVLEELCEDDYSTLVVYFASCTSLKHGNKNVSP